MSGMNTAHITYRVYRYDLDIYIRICIYICIFGGREY